MCTPQTTTEKGPPQKIQIQNWKPKRTAVTESLEGNLDICINMMNPWDIMPSGINQIQKTNTA